jgi:hypothetical protein
MQGAIPHVYFNEKHFPKKHDPRGNSTHYPNHEKHFFEKYNHV